MRIRLCMRLAVSSLISFAWSGAVLGGVEPCVAAWDDVFRGFGDPGDIEAAVEFDDGRGPALFVAGDLVSGGVARVLDGRLEPLPAMSFSSARALIVHDDGSGPALYVAGEFLLEPGTEEVGVVRWRGVEWEPVGTVRSVVTLAEFDEDGDGPLPTRLFAGGFAYAGGFGGIARWDGSAWTSVGGGITLGAYVTALGVIDDGGGAALYAGGPFPIIGGVVVNGVGRWDGVSWSALGGGLPRPDGVLHYPPVVTIAGHDDGSGVAIFAGGRITTQIDGSLVYGLARWDGAAWSGVGLPAFSLVRSAVSRPTESGDELLVAGSFRLDQQEASAVGRWNGVGIEPMPGEPEERTSGEVRDGFGITILESGDALIFGSFDLVNGDALTVDLATWDGETFAPYAEQRGLNDFFAVSSLVGSPVDGSVHVGGVFLWAGGRERRNVARWDTTGAWTSLGDGLNDDVLALALHDDGGGERLFASGLFTGSGDVDMPRGVAVFDGGAWSSVGAVNTGEVLALASIDGTLYAGGTFGSLDGAGPRIAKRMSGAWQAMGAGLSGGAAQVAAIAPWQGGVIVGGSFTNSGGAPVRNVAFWNGASWSAMGEGLNSTVRAFAVHGGELYAAGEFTMSGTSPARYVARWDGTSWRALPGHLSGPAVALASYDDGTGPALYVGGLFNLIDFTQVGRIARWDGVAWSTVESGLNGPVESLLAHQLDGRPALFASGPFTSASGVSSRGIAVWRGCLSACPGDANGDQVIDMADLMIVVDAFNTSEGDELFNESADFDLNGAVDFEDLNRVVAGFNMGC